MKYTIKPTCDGLEIAIITQIWTNGISISYNIRQERMLTFNQTILDQQTANLKWSD